MAEKELIVHSISMVEIDGDTNIPTVVTYASERAIVGRVALSEARINKRVLNEDFKIDLGTYEPGATKKKRFLTARGGEKSAAELTADFLDRLLADTKSWLSFNGLDVAPSLLLAEPLKDPNTPDWIRNYRSNLERILVGKGFSKAKIDFLPEPFAVFQYYRYGFRHPALADRRHHRALVLDFGGGTFDACVVESKRDGDISQSGRNSNPLGASSLPIGGFEINRRIAEHLALKVNQGSESRVRKGLDLYKRWRRASEDLSSLSPEYAHFVLNFDGLVHDVEQSKIALSKNITNWSLDNPPTFSVPFKVPVDLFGSGSSTRTVQVRVSELLKIFVSKVWPDLRTTIESTIRRGRLEMANAPINVVLLSGGSSGFGWLRELLKRDFSSDLGNASILGLPDYHEIVAKGLAIECARRFYVEQGDFGAVTYNRLCLTLDADGRGHDLPRYSPRFVNEKANLPEGVLLPSSWALGNMIGQPIRWKFRLDHPPKKRLDYYFMRSSFDPEEIANLQNVGNVTVHTPQRATFDSTLQVELLVSEDGTALPKFIYKTSRDGSDEVAISGRPFYLDMTYGGGGAADRAYLGIDFGTSNSAIAYLSEQTMDRVDARSSDSNWLSMQELTTALPYPLARPLSRVMGLSTSPESDQGFPRVLEFIEAAVGMLAFTAFLEHCAVSGTQTKLLKNFTKRSIGPLWALLRESLTALGKNASIVAPAMRLLQSEPQGEMDRLVQSLNERKHGKAASSNHDVISSIVLIGNICNDIYATRFFGFFENVQQKRFGKGFAGKFRIAHGPSQPFPLWVEYEGSQSFSDLQPYILDMNTGQALGLEPLGFWDLCEKHNISDEPHFFFLDMMSSSGCSFKALGYECALTVSDDSKYSELHSVLNEWRISDPRLNKIELTSISVPEELGLV